MEHGSVTIGATKLTDLATEKDAACACDSPYQLLALTKYTAANAAQSLHERVLWRTCRTRNRPQLSERKLRCHV